jgi:hypothetical protein
MYLPTPHCEGDKVRQEYRQLVIVFVLIWSELIQQLQSKYFYVVVPAIALMHILVSYSLFISILRLYLFFACK